MAPTLHVVMYHILTAYSTLLAICIVLYFTVDTVYAMSPKDLDDSVDIKISDNTNNISLKYASFVNNSFLHYIELVKYS